MMRMVTEKTEAEIRIAEFIVCVRLVTRSFVAKTDAMYLTPFSTQNPNGVDITHRNSDRRFPTDG